MSKITPTFLLLSTALLFWSLSAGLSDYLADGFAREHSSGSNEAKKAELTADLKQLQEKTEKNPKDIDAQLAYAEASMRAAYQSSDSGLLMQAVKAFHGVLEIEHEHPGALLGLATVCLEAGIIDKALEYYPRYLKQRPDDLSAKTDYAMAFVRAGEAEKARGLLAEVISAKPDFFPALMTSAFAYRAENKLDESLKEAERALKLAPNKEVAAHVEGFIADLKNGGSSASEESRKDLVSPARAIDQYFRQHPIVGPKIVSIKWPSSDKVEIELDNFPVKNMPAFAREKFIRGIKGRISELSEPVTVVLLDSASASELLSVSADKPK